MGLAMDLVALYDTVCGGEIGTNGCHLAVHPHTPPLSILYHLPSSTPIGVPVVLAMPIKNYLKW